MQNLNQLLSQGEGADDKEDILFAASQHVPDAEFMKYMGQKKDDYYDNINDMANADYKTILLKVKTKYNMLLSDKDRPFGSPSKDEQHVIALQAELNEVKDSNLKLSKQLKSKLKSPAPGTNANKVASNTQKTKNSKNNSDRRCQMQDEAWKTVAPKSWEPNRP